MGDRRFRTRNMSTRLTAPAKRYSLPLLLFPVLSGLVDPIVGVFAKFTSIFFHPAPPAKADTPRRRRRGLTLVLGGIEGPSRYNYEMVCAVLKCRYRGSVRRIDWNAGIPFIRSLVNLMHHKHKERQAGEVARIIIDYKREHPGAPVCMIAQSGGCYITLRALELLPPDVRVHTAVLLAPSLSPGYDTSDAAARCDANLISVGGPGDFCFLGIGTLLAGTSDRVFSPSAGWIGWKHHPANFIEARWRPEWLRFGYLGNHTTSSSRRFISSMLAPCFPTRSPHAPLP